MRVLGIETSSRTSSLAILDGSSGLLGELRIHLNLTQSETLMTNLDFLLKNAGVTLESVDALAVSIGPGSFTGLRVGLSAAKGLAFHRRIPVVPVSTLEAMAHMLIMSEIQICPLISSRRDEIYAAIYRAKDGTLERRLEEAPLHPDDLPPRIKEPTIFTGDASIGREAFLRESLGKKALFAPPMLRLPSAVSVADLGMALLNSGSAIPSVETLAPRYLKASEAEIKWEEKQSSA